MKSINSCPQKRNRVNIKAIENGNYPLKNRLEMLILNCCWLWKMLAIITPYSLKSVIF